MREVKIEHVTEAQMLAMFEATENQRKVVARDGNMIGAAFVVALTVCGLLGFGNFYSGLLKQGLDVTQLKMLCDNYWVLLGVLGAAAMCGAWFVGRSVHGAIWYAIEMKRIARLTGDEKDGE